MAEIKSKEWLKSRFETGDIPTQEDYERLLDSYWHKSEMGQVAAGEERPVAGKLVSQAMAGLLETLEEKVRVMIADALPGLLTEVLKDYVTSETLTRALGDRATTAWVQQQLSDKVTRQAVTDALAEKVSATEVYTKAEANELLAMKAATADLPDMSRVALKSELPDVSQLATKQELTQYQAFVNSAVLSKASMSDVNTAVSQVQNTCLTRADADNLYAPKLQ